MLHGGSSGNVLQLSGLADFSVSAPGCCTDVRVEPDKHAQNLFHTEKTDAAFIYPNFDCKVIISDEASRRHAFRMSMAEVITQARLGLKLNSCNKLHFLHGYLSRS